MTGLVLRVALLLFILLPAAAGMVQLVAISNAGYACLVVPVGPDMPEWTLDVRSGRAVWDGRHLGAPIQSGTVSYSPDGRYGLGASERREDERWTPFGWYLEDTHTGMRTPLSHSVGYAVWSADSRTVAYTTLFDETPRQFTVLNLTSGAAHTQPLDYGIIMAELSPNGRYLLLQNPSTFEVWALRMADMHEVARATASHSPFSSPWPLQSNRLMLYSGTQPILYDLDNGTSIMLEEGPPPTNRTPVRSIHWAPNGERFVLLSRHVDNRMVLSLFDADGKPLLPPMEIPGGPSPYPPTPVNVWSADGTRFAVRQGKTLSVIDVATGQREALIDGIERIDFSQGSPAPATGKFLTFFQSSDSGQALTILDLRTLTVASRLIDGATRIIPPVWTTDASRVAVKWEDSAGQTRLTWANRSDFIGHLLDEPGQLYGETAWNPAIFWLGSSPTLLYAAVRGDNRSIYSVNVETGETHTMATGLSGNYAGIMLSESPNGDRFIMSYRARGMTAEVKFDEAEPFVLLSADGRYVRALPSHWYRMYMPVWSPDGTRFAQWNDEGVTHVFDADGNRLIETTTVPYPNQSDFEWTRCEPRRVG